MHGVPTKEMMEALGVPYPEPEQSQKNVRFVKSILTIYHKKTGLCGKELKADILARPKDEIQGIWKVLVEEHKMRSMDRYVGRHFTAFFASASIVAGIVTGGVGLPVIALGGVAVLGYQVVKKRNHFKKAALVEKMAVSDNRPLTASA